MDVVTMTETRAQALERTTASQREEISTAATEPGLKVQKIPAGLPWEGDHPVDIRLSIPLLIGRYYQTIVVGKERRRPQRRAEERWKHPLQTLGNIIAFGLVGIILWTSFLALFQIANSPMMQQSGILILKQ